MSAFFEVIGVGYTHRGDHNVLTLVIGSFTVSPTAEKRLVTRSS